MAIKRTFADMEALKPYIDKEKYDKIRSNDEFFTMAPDALYAMLGTINDKIFFEQPAQPATLAMIDRNLRQDGFSLKAFLAPSIDFQLQRLEEFERKERTPEFEAEQRRYEENLDTSVVD